MGALGFAAAAEAEIGIFFAELADLGPFGR